MKKSGYIAIAGRPNVGKSTLMNSLLGSKLSIATPKAQTTRERVNGILNGPEGQIVFTDTPGIHRAKEGGINAYMMSEVKEALAYPDLIWYLLDPASEPKHEQAVLNALKGLKAPVFLIVNKNDLNRAKLTAESLSTAVRLAAELEGIPLVKTFFISALKNRGTAALIEESWKHLPEGQPHYDDEDQLSDKPMRFFVSEKIREQLFLKLGDEIPYSCAIEIESFEEKPPLPKIRALIHVERDSQKGIVIGEGGKKIKEIGTAARREIEELMGTKVFLGLNVNVMKDWSKNAANLKKLGYDVPGTKRA